MSRPVPATDPRLDADNGRPQLGRLGLATIELIGIFIADLVLAPPIALGAFFAVPLLFCFHIARRREVLQIAVAATVLAPIGAFLSIDGTWTATSTEVVSAVTGIFAIWLTARLLLIRLAEEERLFATRELNEIALGATADSVLVTDARDTVTWLNHSAEQLLGWRLAEAAGRSLSEVYRPDDDTLTQAPLLPEGYVNIRTRSGVRLPVEVTEGGIRDLTGQPRGRVLVLRDASQREAAERELRQLAFRDRLTGLPNRALLAERLELELAHATREELLLAVLFIDLDRFKEVNDTLGHQAGDDLLRGVAARLSSCLRAADTVARLAGDEFVILLPKLRDRGDAVLVAEKVCATLQEPFHLGDHDRTVLPSVGIAMFPDHGTDPQSLLERADEGMYIAKKRGGGRWAFNGEPESPSQHDGTGASG